MSRIAAIVSFCLLSLVGSVLLPLRAVAQATINVPRDRKTIQAGIDAANDGDTVLVAPGKYTENIDFKGKAITVTSYGGAAKTIIDGGASGPVVTFSNSETQASVLSDMTIQNGGGYGSNMGAFGIAGVVVYGSSPTIQNNSITQNECWDIEVVAGGPLIAGNTISSTVSPAGGCGIGSGAGISVAGNLNDDTETSDGSAAVIIGNIIEDITIPATQGSQMFSNLNGENGGAGIAVLGGSPLIENNIIRNNSAPGGNGGGINVAGGSGTTIAQNLIYGNSAGCGGGAISFGGTYTDDNIDLLVANNTIADNTGGSADLYSSCSDASQIDGVNFGQSSPNVVFVNNIVSGNSAAPAVGCYSLASTPSETEQSIFDHNLLYNAGGEFFGTTCVDVSAKYGNVAAAPQFMNAAGGDYQLVLGSIGIDIGNNSALENISDLSGTTLTTDFERKPRVQDARGNGYPIIDMGAYESLGAVDGSPTTIVLTSTTYDGKVGTPLTLDASIQSALGVPTGRIIFFLNGQQLGTSSINSQGSAYLPSIVPGPGANTLYAAYQGVDGFIPARSVIIIITGDGTPATKTYATTLEFGANINRLMYGMDVTFTALVSSADPNPLFVPSPIVLTLNDGAVIASLTTMRDGLARLTTTTLPAGSDVVTATYAGDATHEAATASYTVQVQPISTSLSLACTMLDLQIGETSLLTATVTASSGTPTGPVLFTDNGSELGAVILSDGTATWNYVASATGYHRLQAYYAKSGNFAAALAACAPPPGVLVTGLPSTSILSVVPTTGPFQTTTTLTARVSPTVPPGIGAATGTVEFLDGPTVIVMADLAGGVATFITHELPAGSNALTCMYGGDSTYAPSSCNVVPVTTSVAQAVLTLTASDNNVPALTPVTFTVKLSATGQPDPMKPVVVVTLNGQIYPLTLNASGSAGLIVSTLLPGTYLLTATFPGNADLSSASASLTETVVTSPSATALAASPNPAYSGQSVTITAMVTVPDTLVPEGTVVSFFDGTAALGTGILDSARAATLTTTALTVGTHALTASYPGTNVFLGSTSQVVDETILGSSFTIALAPSTVTVPTDQKATVSIQLASIGGFAGPLTLSYGALPMNATASILPTTVTLTAGGSGSSVLSLNTYTKTTVAMENERYRGIRGWPAIVASAFLLLLPRRRRLRVTARKILWMMLLVCMTQAATGCGNSFYTLPGVAPGNYQIQVTATDINQHTQTAVLTLNVTPR